MAALDPEKDDIIIEDEIMDRGDVKDVVGQGRKKKRKIDHALFFDDEMGFKKLLKDFTRIKFRGKGHEKEDLKLMMREYRQWFSELLVQDVDLESICNQTRNALMKKDVSDKKEDKGKISDPKERLTWFRCEYKNPKAADEATASGAQKALTATPAASTLTEEQMKRIAENRKKALEKKRQKDGEEGKENGEPPVVAASEPGSQPAELDMEVQWRIEQNRLKALEKKKQKELEAAAVPTKAATDLDDPFGFDDFYPEDDFGFDGGMDE